MEHESDIGMVELQPSRGLASRDEVDPPDEGRMALERAKRVAELVARVKAGFRESIGEVLGDPVAQRIEHCAPAGDPLRVRSIHPGVDCVDLGAGHDA